MENKVLIKLIFLEIDEEFDLFIPVNEVIWKINKMLIKSITDLSNVSINTKKEYMLINKTTMRRYNNNEIVINTDIRNGTELLLISQE